MMKHKYVAEMTFGIVRMRIWSRLELFLPQNGFFDS